MCDNDGEGSQYGQEAVLDQSVRMHRRYAGALDDSVSRYPWAGHQPTQDYLRRLLIDNALFGQPCCARVGNILYHKPYFNALLNPETSPLRAMLDVGFFQMQLRSETINDTIAVRKAEQTNSTLNFIKETGWDSPSSEIRAELEKIDNLLEPSRGKRKYSVNFRPFFDILVQEALHSVDASTIDLIERVDASWREKHERFGARLTRSTFEQTAQELFAAGKIPEMQTAMRWINSVNHYAYGAGMKSQNHDEDVSVDSAKLKHLTDLCTIEQNISQDAVTEFLGLKGEMANALRQSLTLPKALVHTPELWRRMARLVDIEPDEQHDNATIFQYRKTVLLCAIRTMHRKPDSNLIQELKDIARAYSAALYKGLGLSPASADAAILTIDTVAHGNHATAAEQARLMGADETFENKCIGTKINMNEEAGVTSCQSLPESYRVEWEGGKTVGPAQVLSQSFGSLCTGSEISLRKTTRIERRIPKIYK